MAQRSSRSRAGTSKNKAAKGTKGSRTKVPRPQAACRSKTGCFTCRIRRKKCDEEVDGSGNCSTCSRLRIQCLGFGGRRPAFLKDQVEGMRQRIKERLSKSSSGPHEDSEVLILFTDPSPSCASTALPSPSPVTPAHIPLPGIPLIESEAEGQEYASDQLGLDGAMNEDSYFGSSTPDKFEGWGSQPYASDTAPRGADPLDLEDLLSLSGGYTDSTLFNAVPHGFEYTMGQHPEDGALADMFVDMA